MSLSICRRGRNLVKRHRRKSVKFLLILIPTSIVLGVIIRLRISSKYRNLEKPSYLDDSIHLKDNLRPEILPFSQSTTEGESSHGIVRENSLIDHESTVIITAVNYAFRSHLTNLKCSLDRIGISEKLKVVALDELVATWAQKAGFQVFQALDGSEKSVITEDARFGSASFNLLSKRKISAVATELSTGRNVLFTDADMFWCGNALREIIDLSNTHSEADLLMQSAWPRSLLNSGFYFARSNENTMNLFSELLRHGGSEENDQVIFNRVLCQRKEGGHIVHAKGDSLLHRKNQKPLGCSRNNTFAMVLDRNRYPTGGEIIEGKKIFHHSRNFLTSKCERNEMMILHNNCIFSDKKTARFIVKGFWYAAEDGISCSKHPAPVTKKALKRCGKPKCGKTDEVELQNSKK